MESHHSRVGANFESSDCRWIQIYLFQLLDRYHRDHRDSERHSRGREHDRERSRDRYRHHDRHRDRDRDSSRKGDHSSDRTRRSEQSAERKDSVPHEVPIIKTEAPAPKSVSELPDISAATIAAMEAAKKVSLPSLLFRAFADYVVQASAKPRMSRFSSSLLTKKVYFPLQNDINYKAIFNGPFRVEVETDTHTTLTVGGKDVVSLVISPSR